MSKTIKLKDKKIGDGEKPVFIGEIGINHNGSIEIAKRIIDMAKICGVEFVKFQKRTPEICVPVDVRNRIIETPWGEMTYFDYKKKVEFGLDEFKIIDNYCKEKQIIWFASVWDIPSVDFMEKFDTPCYKVPSAKLTDKELLDKLRSTCKPIILSTGMSTQDEIDKAISFLNNTELVIMHCNSSYPAKDEELNLNYIKTLKIKYPQHIIGYSGHEEGITPSLVAALLGAKLVERHITIDRAMWGTDQGASIEFSGLRRLVRDLNLIDKWLGDGIKKLYESEIPVKKKLRDKETL
ncbi:MAG: N-acetylneuraminate synthase family protein [Actinomycetota bacterium]|nr:N-acetylneuraminate synthase family protein [Actinomycetota bacterium]